MCLYKKSDFKISDEPIECFKIMKYVNDWDKNKIISIYHNSLFIDKESGYEVGDYIKASTKLSPFKYVNRKKINKLTELKGEVVHSYIEPPMMPNWDNCVFVRCEIPRNEAFCSGNQSSIFDTKVDQYGSLSLQIKEIIRDEWRINFHIKNQVGNVLTYKIPSFVNLDAIIKMTEEKKREFICEIIDFEIYRHNTETYEIEKVYSTIN